MYSVFHLLGSVLLSLHIFRKFVLNISAPKTNVVSTKMYSNLFVKRANLNIGPVDR